MLKVIDEFPGFAECTAMLRKRKSMTQEAGFFWLQPRAGEFVEPLLAELETEQDVETQSWIIELLVYARSVRALPVFLRHLSSPNQSLRVWAEHGLCDLRRTRGKGDAVGFYWKRTSPPILLSADDERLLHETLERILH